MSEIHSLAFNLKNTITPVWLLESHTVLAAAAAVRTQQRDILHATLAGRSHGQGARNNFTRSELAAYALAQCRPIAELYAGSEEVIDKLVAHMLKFKDLAPKGTHGSAPSLRRALALVMTLTLISLNRRACMCFAAQVVDEDEEEAAFSEALGGAGPSGRQNGAKKRPNPLAEAAREVEEEDEEEEAARSGRSGLQDPPPLAGTILNPKTKPMAGKPKQKRNKGAHESSR
ncbi:hypothetical protein T492DRAFT_896256 [Pavlovales sp. CCMP2436]|nr:hypothetical protein T492DRAFT_896256 [Pavlovales sp. CCMP2436]